jgi:PAS domain S-box-containing protein
LELLVQVLASALDRQSADLALRESEARLSLASDAARVGLWRLDLATGLYWLTNKTRELFGLAADEALDFERFLGLVHPDDRERVRLTAETVVQSQKEGQVEYRIVRSDGTMRWVLSRGRAHGRVSRTPQYLTGVSVDITERKQTEETLRNVSGRLIAAQEEERARLARELHDGLSQDLALEAVELELMGQRPPTTAGEITRRMQELSAQLKKLSSEVHRIAHDLHPAKLTQLGLAAAIAELCQTGSSAHHLPIAFDHNPVPRTLPPGVVLGLYRVAQESIQNALRHSAASSIRVELVMEADEIRLSVADDGRGFNVESQQVAGKLGLVSMRERVRLVHGRIDIESSPGAGTRIRVSTPLTNGTQP